MQLPPHAQLIAPRADLAYLDSQSVTLPAPITALEAWRRVMAKPLPGLRWAFWLRDAISARFGVQRIGGFSGAKVGAPQVGDHLDFFLIEHIDDQVLALTGGKGVDCAIIAGGDVDTFIPVVKILKPGGRIGNVNYLGSGDYVKIPRADWGVGMGHKLINGGLMPGGRLRMEKLAALMTSGRLDVKPLITHVFDGWDKLPQALQLMKDKPQDLIKPVVRL